MDPADAGRRNVRLHETVPQGQRIVGAQLIVRARITSDTALRSSEHIGKRIDDPQCGGVERGAIDDGSVIDGVPSEIEKERGALAHWPAEVPSGLPKQKRCLLERIRIAGIPEVV